MADREHVRVPLTVAVEFRTASSFLIAYSVNVSRGGLFVETGADVALGSEVTIELNVPTAGPLRLHGVVAWRRGDDSPDGRTGVGVEFRDVDASLGAAIDAMIATYHGMSVVVMTGDSSHRSSLARLVRSVMSTANVVSAADLSNATTVLTRDVDVALVDLDDNTEAGFATLRAAATVIPAIPTIAMSNMASRRDEARTAGASEVSANPPTLDDLRLVLLRAAGRPLSFH